MEITREYNVELVEWQINEFQDFLGSNQPTTNYAVSLTPPYEEDPAYCFFTIIPKFFIFNENKGNVISCSSKSCFLIKNKGIAPSIDILYSLVVAARNSLNEIYLLKNVETIQRNHNIPPVKLEEVKLILAEAIKLSYIL